MKKIFVALVILLSLGLIGTSCSNDEVNYSLPVARDFETDVQILTKFVDINKSIGEYYINESQKYSLMSYVSNKDWKELQKVNPVNRARFEEHLKTTNLELASVAKRNDVSQIVYTTYRETWIRNIGNDNHIMLEEGNPVGTIATKAGYARMSLRSGYMPQTISFNAGRQIRSHITVDMPSWQYYFFEIVCLIDADINPNGGSSVVMSGTGVYAQYSFTWTANSGSTNILWKFKGKLIAPRYSPTANVHVRF